MSNYSETFLLHENLPAGRPFTEEEKYDEIVKKN